ncbi:PH domain-containing protein [Galbitalea soli]|uniref:PH domain-containing protein n=1 Tax=Galbitalea soli TaxID=1268042 RepID=A0A7C9TRH2_9MICO|nr:PH domain-containing protein [Galbitalea soli]NEM91322.1 PH domain-containing protein [Galbitalea soli]NYJ30012.1 membrane protein YdbS with pleckstrin-like domain [Galbitalea soli]
MSDEPTAQERVVARLRPHARRMLWPSLALIVIAGATGYSYGLLPEPWQNTGILAAGALLAVLLFLLPLLSWLGRNYTITTRRIVLRRGLFVRVRQELLHSRGYDVTVRRAGLQGAFRSGDVQINSGLEHPIVLTDVPGADLVQATLHDLMEANASTIAARRQQVASTANDETTLWGTR